MRSSNEMYQIWEQSKSFKLRILDDKQLKNLRGKLRIILQKKV